MVFSKRQWTLALIGAVAAHALLALLFSVHGQSLFQQPKPVSQPGVSLSLEPLGPAPEPAVSSAPEIAQAPTAATPQTQPQPGTAGEPAAPGDTQPRATPNSADIPEAATEVPPEAAPEPAPGAVRAVVAKPLTVTASDVAAGNPESKAANPRPPPARTRSPQSAVGGGRGHISAEYINRLRNRLARYKSYPAAARKQHVAGTVELSFVVDRSGDLIESHVRSGAGNQLLEQAVREMLERAQPLPPIPAAMRHDRLQVTLQIQFALRPGQTPPPRN